MGLLASFAYSFKCWLGVPFVQYLGDLPLSYFCWWITFQILHHCTKNYPSANFPLLYFSYFFTKTIADALLSLVSSIGNVRYVFIIALISISQISLFIVDQNFYPVYCRDMVLRVWSLKVLQDLWFYIFTTHGMKLFVILPPCPWIIILTE